MMLKAVLGNIVPPGPVRVETRIALDISIKLKDADMARRVIYKEGGSAVGSISEIFGNGYVKAAVEHAIYCQVKEEVEKALHNELPRQVADGVKRQISEELKKKNIDADVVVKNCYKK